MNFQEQRALEILKSLVEISVSGFKTLALLNGGGAIALLTYLGREKPLHKFLYLMCLLRVALLY